MRKSVNPVVAIVVVVVVVIVAVWLFARAAKTKKVMFIPGAGRLDPKTGKSIGPQGRRGAAAQQRGGGQEQAPAGTARRGRR